MAPTATRRKTAPRSTAATKTARRKSAPRKTRSASTKKRTAGRYWSGRVTRESDALDLQGGVFKLKDPKRIAASLKRSAERSHRRKAEPYRSALSMLVFYINRAGKNLPASRRRTLEQAKLELRKQFGRDKESRTPRVITHLDAIAARHPPPRSGGGGPCEAWWRGARGGAAISATSKRAARPSPLPPLCCANIATLASRS